MTIATGHARIVALPCPAPVGAERTDLSVNDRVVLLAAHRAARERRERAALGSDDYRAAAEEVGRIEVALNRLTEPQPEPPTAA